MTKTHNTTETTDSYKAMCDRERARKDALDLPCAIRVRMPKFTEGEAPKNVGRYARPGI
jgi:hypothetical protein